MKLFFSAVFFLLLSGRLLAQPGWYSGTYGDKADFAAAPDWSTASAGLGSDMSVAGWTVDLAGLQGGGSVDSLAIVNGNGIGLDGQYLGVSDVGGVPSVSFGATVADAVAGVLASGSLPAGFPGFGGGGGGGLSWGGSNASVLFDANTQNASARWYLWLFAFWPLALMIGLFVWFWRKSRIAGFV